MTIGSLTIERIETNHIYLPPRRDHRWRGLLVGLGHFVIVRIDAGGFCGWGEAVPLLDWGGDYERYGGESPQTVTHVIRDYVTPALHERDARHVRRLSYALDQKIRGHTYAKAAVEMALLDLVGRATNLPVYQLLGGAVRDQVAVAHMVGLMPLDDAVREATMAVDDGVRALQIKGGHDIDRDLNLVRAIASSVGPAVTLRLDANQGYGTVKEVLPALRAMADAGLHYLEQPFEGAHALRAAARELPIPIIADESCWRPHDALDLVRNDSVDALSIYVGKAGGLLRAQQVATIAETADLPCDVNGSLELGIGNAANLHFALATPAVTLPSVVPVNAPAGAHTTQTAGRYFDDDIIVDPFTYDAGALQCPEGPGLGVTVNEEKVNQYKVMDD